MSHSQDNFFVDIFDIVEFFFSSFHNAINPVSKTLLLFQRYYLKVVKK